MRIASIGPETTKALKKLGFSPDAEAKEHSIAGLVRALRENVRAA
jgi:uroporphyrinogen-III synthase